MVQFPMVNHVAKLKQLVNSTTNWTKLDMHCGVWDDLYVLLNSNYARLITTRTVKSYLLQRENLTTRIFTQSKEQMRVFSLSSWQVVSYRQGTEASLVGQHNFFYHWQLVEMVRLLQCPQDFSPSGCAIAMVIIQYSHFFFSGGLGGFLFIFYLLDFDFGISVRLMVSLVWNWNL